jgi:hypothetical protein
MRFYLLKKLNQRMRSKMGKKKHVKLHRNKKNDTPKYDWEFKYLVAGLTEEKAEYLSEMVMYAIDIAGEGGVGFYSKIEDDDKEC